MAKKCIEYRLTVIFRSSKWLRALLGPDVSVIFVPDKKLLEFINGEKK